MTTSSLSPFFTPQGVAIIGASADPGKLGYRLAHNLVDSGYLGGVYFINPKGGSLLGREMIRTIAEIPDPVDLGVLLIPAQIVPQTLHECGKRGIRAVIISSGGFKETGAEGAALELECLGIARQYGMRLIGPNCVGVIDTHVPLDTSFLPPPGALVGEMAFISHSGVICDVAIDWARSLGFGLSRLVSLGNQADVTETDVLAPVAADPYTRVITLYLEGVGDGPRFVVEASRASRLKPIVAIKLGRSAGGQRAAASHTGALVGQDHAFEAAFRRAGVMRANTSEELYDWSRALAWCSLPAGRQVGILTMAGGAGVIAADAVDTAGLQLIELQETTQAAMRAVLPAAASVRNPVDMLGSATPDQYIACLRAMLADPGVQSLLIIIPPPPMGTADAIAEAIIPLIKSAEIPVVLALIGGNLVSGAARLLRTAQIPEYPFPESAVSALGVLARRAEYLAQPERMDEVLPGMNTQAARKALMTAEENGAAEALAAYGIPLPAVELAYSADEAAQIATRLGFPVVLKIASPDILHKSDVGGVLLNRVDAESVRQGYEQVVANARHARPQAVISGVHIQRMITSGQEVIVGMVRDAQFGPLVMFGSGGVEVEGLKDVTFELAPLNRNEAEAMLDRTWAGRKLRGFRNLPPADREAVIDVLMRLAQLAVDFPHIAEIEINPLRVLLTGQGAFAVDVRASYKTEFTVED
jgi:acetyl coenzyme A synthetase (ADP forming)-like protein